MAFLLLLFGVESVDWFMLKIVGNYLWTWWGERETNEEEIGLLSHCLVDYLERTECLVFEDKHKSLVQLQYLFF